MFRPLVLAWVVFMPVPGLVAQDGKRFDWPQWQGPKRTAISEERGLLQTWPKEGPPLVWKVKGIGTGFSSPSIARGRIFVMGNRPEDNDVDKKIEYVFGLDEMSGKHVWAYPVGPERSSGGGYPGPRCTPTVDGERVYALGLNGDLVCLDFTTGQELWKKDLRSKEFLGVPGGWGYTESPLVDGDRVLVTPGGKKATIVALDKITGKTIWTSQVPQGDRAGYASIAIVDMPGHRQYAQFLGKGVVGVDAGTGKFLWRYDAPANSTANISTPIYHAGHVFAASAYGTGGGLVKLDREGDTWTAREVYFTPNMQNHHGGMVLLNGHLYGNNGQQLACLEFLTGKVKWQSKTPGKGSIAYADGCLYYRNERGKGEVFLIEASPEKYVERGRFEQPDRSRASAWAHPVIANGRLYLADQDTLLCYDVKKK